MRSAGLSGGASMFQGIDERMTKGVRCAGTICDELEVADPPVQRQIVLEMDTHARNVSQRPRNRQGPWCSETSWTKRHDTWAHAIASCSGSGGNRRRWTDGVSLTHGIETVRGERRGPRNARSFQVSPCTTRNMWRTGANH